MQVLGLRLYYARKFIFYFSGTSQNLYLLLLLQYYQIILVTMQCTQIASSRDTESRVARLDLGAGAYTCRPCDKTRRDCVTKEIVC